jgi:hypothetical protein
MHPYHLFLHCMPAAISLRITWGDPVLPLCAIRFATSGRWKQGLLFHTTRTLKKTLSFPVIYATIQVEALLIDR